MNKLTIFKKATLGITALASSLLMNGAVASAIIPYDGPNTPNSPVPAWNVFTGVPSVGDERDFLRARVPTGTGDSSTPYVDPLNTTCVDGQKIQMRVYAHNGASVDGNQNGTGPSVAHGAKVKVNLDNDTAKAVFNPSATLSSTNAGTITDGATINCNGKSVKLKYLVGSASAFSKATGVVPVSDAVVTAAGASIRSQSVPGDVWGCWDDRVYVILSVVVEEVPVTPPSLGECKVVDFKIEDHKVNVTKVTPSLTNATVVGHKINWGDGTTSDKEIDSHTYAKDGTYTVTVSVQVKFADGHTEWKTAAGCARKVTFKANVTPVVVTTTPTPTTLPKTGSGDVAGIFAAVTVAGALVHRYVLSRRFQ